MCNKDHGLTCACESTCRSSRTAPNQRQMPLRELRTTALYVECCGAHTGSKTWHLKIGDTLQLFNPCRAAPPTHHRSQTSHRLANSRSLQFTAPTAARCSSSCQHPHEGRRCQCPVAVLKSSSAACFPAADPRWRGPGCQDVTISCQQ
jgi:hypothetical protein